MHTNADLPLAGYNKLHRMLWQDLKKMKILTVDTEIF